MRLPTVRPSGWKVRTRSTVVAAVVVTVGMAVASAAMLLVLYHTLQQSAQQAAEARAVQLVEQLRTDAPADLDPGLLGTDGQVGVIQILNPRGMVVASSSDAPATPLVSQTVPPGQSAFLGHVEIAGDNGDYWMTAHGADSPAGPVTAAHHGTVQVSDRVGGGACFIVTLPADIDSYVAAEASR